MTLLLAALAVALAGCSDDSSDDGTTVTITVNNASLAGKTFTYSDTSGGYENTITFGDDGKTFTYKRTYTSTTGNGSGTGTGTGTGTVSTFSYSEDVTFYDEDQTYVVCDYTGLDVPRLAFTSVDSGLTTPRDGTDAEAISTGSSYQFYVFCRVTKSGEITYAQIYSERSGWYNITFEWGDYTIGNPFYARKLANSLELLAKL